MKHYAGLDISDKTTSICVVSQDGSIMFETTASTDPISIKEALKACPSYEKLGVECGALTHYLVTGLRLQGFQPICLDSRQMGELLKLNINKTDRNDARAIAEALRCGYYKEVHVKSSRAASIHTMLTGRKALVNQRTCIKNTIRGLLKSQGIRIRGTVNRTFIKKVEADLTNVPMEVKAAVSSLLRSFAFICDELDQLNKTVTKAASSDEDVVRLMTIPGIGPITALAFKHEIDLPGRFKKSRSVGVYMGLTPRQYASGETRKQGRISKRGPKEMRSLLVEAGMVLLTRSKKWSKLKAWGLKIMRRSGAKKAAVALGRKLAIIMHRMLIEKTEFIYGEKKAA